MPWPTISSSWWGIFGLEVGSVSQINSLSPQIATAAEQQSAVTEEINRSIGKLMRPLFSASLFSHANSTGRCQARAAAAAKVMLATPREAGVAS